MIAENHIAEGQKPQATSSTEEAATPSDEGQGSVEAEGSEGTTPSPASDTDSGAASSPGGATPTEATPADTGAKDTGAKDTASTPADSPAQGTPSGAGSADTASSSEGSATTADTASSTVAATPTEATPADTGAKDTGSKDTASTPADSPAQGTPSGAGSADTASSSEGSATTADTTATQDKKWFIVQAHSNFENKVAEAISHQAKLSKLETEIEEAFVPKEKVVEVRRGARVQSERKIFPGYVLVKMDMNAVTHNMIKNLPKVIGFLGDDNEKMPRPVSDEEINSIMRKVKEGEVAPKPSVSFVVGEQIRVSDGPFTSFNGIVEEVDEDKARLKVTVSIFGRSTPVELSYNQVEKG